MRGLPKKENSDGVIGICALIFSSTRCRVQTKSANTLKVFVSIAVKKRKWQKEPSRHFHEDFPSHQGDPHLAVEIGRYCLIFRPLAQGGIFKIQKFAPLACARGIVYNIRRLGEVGESPP